MTRTESEASLKIRNNHKRFPGVYALKNASIDAYPGEVLALLGVNGAGKSTLMNILGGVLQADEGEIFINGTEAKILSPRDSEKYGIAFIQQEIQLFYNMTVYENIFLINLKDYKKYKMLPFLDKKLLREKAAGLLSTLGCYVNPNRKVNTLSVGEQQMVQIARALSQGGEILLFDEPTSSLSMKEKEKLFEIIRHLRDSQKTIIYITHYLDEVEKICDKVVIMRDGQIVGYGHALDFDKKRISDLMTPLERSFSKIESASAGKIVLSIRNLSGLKYPIGVNFDLHKGEVLGLWGLLGSGRSETIRTTLGFDEKISGEILYTKNGELEPIEPKKLFKECGYVTEGRHFDGLFLPMPLWENITSANLHTFSRNFFRVLNKKKEKNEGEKYIGEMRIASPDCDMLTQQLSGGNQQKVVIAKWLSKKSDILFLDEPTRGVDVGSKMEIQYLIRKLASEGVSCVVVSSEVEEIQEICDRIIVLREGAVAAELSKSEINNQRLIKACLGEV
ncbi:MAG: sugar ABC transporter ATP-binding protein [Synergistaceae bacterium]|jgi:ribose transport system ATP-binding protein|nr:sugar ABC transporter ATP-binding protein [Synergistaceae bacterium]